MTSGEPPPPSPSSAFPPPPPLPTAERSVSIGTILLRALLPPLALGFLGSTTVALKSSTDNNILIGLLSVGPLAAVASAIHLSVQIVTRPAEPPLGLPRALSGVLLFFALGVFQIVIACTAFFGGCMCLSTLGANIGGMH